MTPTPDDIRKARAIVGLDMGRQIGSCVAQMHDAIAQALRAEREAERERCQALISQLRKDLLAFQGDDHSVCEGCGAPIGYDEEASTVSDVFGCWGYVSDTKNAPCYRYRTEQGAERSWPPCALLRGGKTE